MVRTKVKSREEKCKEQWLKYFKNIEKENDIIRELLRYYNEKIGPLIVPLDKDTYIDEEGIEYTFAKYEIEEFNEVQQVKNVNEVADSNLRYELEKANGNISLLDEEAPSERKVLLNYKRRLKILEELQEETQDLKPKMEQKSFSSLILGDFKGFSKENEEEDNTINIKPITLIYGPNSYGKSSILQSLLLLHQTAKYGGDYKEVCLLPKGDVVNLGTFKDFLNKNSKDKEVTIEISLPWNQYEGISILSKLSFCFHFALEQNQVVLPQIDILTMQIDYSNPSNPQEKEKELLYTFKRKNGQTYYQQSNEIETIDKDNYFEENTEKISFFKLKDFMAGGPFEQLENIIKEIIYVSSFRKQPDRVYIPENNKRKYVGKSGEHTTEILYDDDIMPDINKWLGEIANYKLSDDNKNNSSIKSINLDDSETHVQNINILDLGSGIAQVLPIITQAFRSENDMILIEEPEIHLHPKAQAELGEMFAKAAQEKHNTFIIETHSENLMLRLERLIKKGELSKDDVSIIYVDKDETGSHCIPLILNNNGDIENIEDVPGGFFEEGFDELFDIPKENKRS